MSHPRAAFLLLFAATTALAQEGNARALKLANGSAGAQSALKYIEWTASSMISGPLKDAVTALVANPAPSFLERLQTPEAKEAARAQLVAAGLLDSKVTVEQLFPPIADFKKAPQPFLAAPAQSLHGHHSYPGGLAEHTAMNLRSALALSDNYQQVFGVSLDRSYVIAAPILHDAMKPWCLQWKADGTTTQQATVAGTSSHHPFVVAEAFHRKLPVDFIVALASAHDPPLPEGGAKVVGYLRAGAILAGVDPVAAGALVKQGDAFALAHPPRIEATINHLSDHDYVLADPAAKLTDDLLDRLARAQAAKEFDELRLRWMRHRVQTKISGVALYALWSAGGDAAVLNELKKRKIELVDDSDAKP